MTDELYARAVTLVLSMNKASTSFLQRKLNLGYLQAFSLIERMEIEGIIGPRTKDSQNHAVIVQETPEGAMAETIEILSDPVFSERLLTGIEQARTGMTVSVETASARLGMIPAYQQRVIDEAIDLKAKLNGLQGFIPTETFAGLDPEERSRMVEQEGFMRGYHDVLSRRISAFTSK